MNRVHTWNKLYNLLMLNVLSHALADSLFPVCIFTHAATYILNTFQYRDLHPQKRRVHPQYKIT